MSAAAVFAFFALLVLGCVSAVWVAVKCVRRGLWRWWTIVFSVPAGAIGSLLIGMVPAALEDTKADRSVVWVLAVFGALLLAPFAIGVFKLRHAAAAGKKSAPALTITIDDVPPPPPLRPMAAKDPGTKAKAATSTVSKVVATVLPNQPIVSIDARDKPVEKDGGKKPSRQKKKPTADTPSYIGEYRFTYMDASDMVGERTALINRVSRTTLRRYFHGFRSDTHESRSYRVDRVIGDMVNIETGEVFSAKKLHANWVKLTQ